MNFATRFMPKAQSYFGTLKQVVFLFLTV